MYRLRFQLEFFIMCVCVWGCSLNKTAKKTNRTYKFHTEIGVYLLYTNLHTQRELLKNTVVNNRNYPSLYLNIISREIYVLSVYAPLCDILCGRLSKGNLAHTDRHTYVRTPSIWAYINYLSTGYSNYKIQTVRHDVITSGGEWVCLSR